MSGLVWSRDSISTPICHNVDKDSVVAETDTPDHKKGEETKVSFKITCIGDRVSDVNLDVKGTGYRLKRKSGYKDWWLLVDPSNFNAHYVGHTPPPEYYVSSSIMFRGDSLRMKLVVNVTIYTGTKYIAKPKIYHPVFVKK